MKWKNKVLCGTNLSVVINRPSQKCGGFLFPVYFPHHPDGINGIKGANV